MFAYKKEMNVVTVVGLLYVIFQCALIRRQIYWFHNNGSQKAPSIPESHSGLDYLSVPRTCQARRPWWWCQIWEEVPGEGLSNNSTHLGDTGDSKHGDKHSLHFTILNTCLISCSFCHDILQNIVLWRLLHLGMIYIKYIHIIYKKCNKKICILR